MTSPGFNQQHNRAASAGIYGLLRLLPFYFVALAILGCMAWLVPNNYREIETSRIVPEGTAPEKVLDYLKGLSKEQRNALIARERSNFGAEPLDRSALFNLGVLYGLDGDRERSNALALQAANRSFRDLGAQTMAINLSLAKKNFDDVLFRLDGLLRSRPEFSKDYYPLILNISTQPDGLRATAKVLATDPPWRRSFMEFAAQQSDQKSVVYEIFSALRGIKADVSSGELRLFIQQLFKVKDFETAYFVWLDFLSPLELSKVGAVFDSGFDVAVDNLNYGWNLWPVANSELKIIPKASVGDDLALSVQFSSLKENLPGVSQYLRLDSGSYHFGGEMKTFQLVTPVGLNWRIACVDSPVQIGAGPTLSESGAWKFIEFSFSVPSENCGTQILYLNWQSEAALDHVVDGTIMFDNLKIEKLGE